jgi:hypothetical protein
MATTVRREGTPERYAIGTYVWPGLFNPGNIVISKVNIREICYWNTRMHAHACFMLTGMDPIALSGGINVLSVNEHRAVLLSGSSVGLIIRFAPNVASSRTTSM